MATARVGNTAVMEAYPSLSGQYPNACHVGKIMSAGGMIGTALLFPITYADGLPFRSITITIFILSHITFLALHLEPFSRYGQYTAPLASFILLIVVLFGAPSNRRDIIPWLPLYVVGACLFTVIIHNLPWRITRNPYLPVTQVYGSSDVALPSTTPYRSRRPSWDGSEPNSRPPSQSHLNDDINFGNMGPSSAYSAQSGSGRTEITLNNLDGAIRNPQIATIFGSSDFNLHRPTPEHLASATTRGSDPYEAAIDMEHGYARPSQDSTHDSRAPLLRIGSYD